MARHLGTEEKSKINMLFELGYSITKISEIFKVDRSTIYRTFKKTNNNSETKALGRGKPRKIDEKLGKYILKENKNNSMVSLRKTSLLCAENKSINISKNTIKRFLNENKIYAFSPTKKPLLSDLHIKNRFEISKRIFFQMYNDYNKIIFTDETKINLKFSDGKIKVWRKKRASIEKKNIQGTVKYGGGSVMIWGCFSRYGIGKIKFIEGRMKASDYIEILQNEFLNSAAEAGIETPILLQDNDPKHTAKLTKEFLKTNNIKTMPWPSQSPDLNPIENLWDYIKREIEKYKPKNIAELKTTIEHVWYGVPNDLCARLADSFKKRVKLCIDRKGNILNK